ncbi:MAG: hypothetical protein CL512_06520 [Actinobacteria bacterium]|nr:hypothetical protein [Actinomycetota bacterium]
MTSRITKYEFLKIMNNNEAWKNLIPSNRPLRWGYVPNNGTPFELRWSYIEYDKELNPIWHLQNAKKLLSFGYITTVRYNTIKLRCLTAYWKNWLPTKDWREWYKAYCYNKDKEAARKRFSKIFVQEYIDRQKEELAAGCSKLVFRDRTQISEDLQNKIMEYI